MVTLKHTTSLKLYAYQIFSYMITDHETSKNWMLFEHFKMHLYDPQNTFNNIDVENIDYIFDNDESIDYKVNELKQELEAVNGTKYSSELVFIEVFKYIHKECKRYLKKQKIKANNDEIQWILTVPSIWTEKAKYRIKSWPKRLNYLNTVINVKLYMNQMQHQYLFNMNYSIDI